MLTDAVGCRAPSSAASASACCWPRDIITAATLLVLDRCRPRATSVFERLLDTAKASVTVASGSSDRGQISRALMTVQLHSLAGRRIRRSSQLVMTGGASRAVLH